MSLEILDRALTRPPFAGLSEPAVLEHAPPSFAAAYDFVRGKPESLGPLIGSWLVRAGVIGTGMWLAGYPTKYVAKGALAGSAAIEVAVLLYASSLAKKTAV